MYQRVNCGTILAKVSVVKGDHKRNKVKENRTKTKKDRMNGRDEKNRKGRGTK